jgi:hypothetical protein
MYTPIAPLPLETPRSHGTKRVKEEGEDTYEEPKRRKRSDSQISSQFELSEEDRLLLQLKEQESMPWKDIAARFLKVFNRTYQIPALQMRIKRLKERMRVWTDQDVQALRKAHDYWAQNKFDIIAQKVHHTSSRHRVYKLTLPDDGFRRDREVELTTMLAQMARD